MTKTRLALMSLATLAAAAPAWAAETPAAIARDFGLLGVWAQDCAEPANPENLRSTYSANPAGGVDVVDKTGEGTDEVSNARLEEVRRLDANTLVFTQVGDGQRVRLTILRDGERSRVVQSVELASGRALIKDAHFADDSQETPWFQHCPAT